MRQEEQIMMRVEVSPAEIRCSGCKISVDGAHSLPVLMARKLSYSETVLC